MPRGAPLSKVVPLWRNKDRLEHVLRQRQPGWGRALSQVRGHLRQMLLNVWRAVLWVKWLYLCLAREMGHWGHGAAKFRLLQADEGQASMTAAVSSWSRRVRGAQGRGWCQAWDPPAPRARCPVCPSVTPLYHVLRQNLAFPPSLFPFLVQDHQ